MLEHSQIARLLDIANAGCHRGLIQEARTIYENVLVLKPGHSPARIGLALSHLVIDEFEKAEEILREVLAENAVDAEARAMLGLCLTLAGKKDDAREYLDTLASEENESARLASSLLTSLH